jgi:hypothetical protein
MEEDKLKEYLQFQLNRNIINVYKKLFEIIDDLKQDHVSMMKKISEAAPAELVKNVDYFDADRYNYIRKKILDVGNDAIRNLDTNLKSVKITLK